MTKTKKLSPFSVEFWVNKGYDIESAEYKRNSIRPIRKEYWLERGFDEIESVKKAKEFKDSNNKKGSKASSNRPKEEFKKNSIRCLEYWIDKGYNEEEAKNKVKESQSTFSLEKCIEKYGIIEGLEVWENRQEKWQTTLNSKTVEEIERINKNKNSIRLKDSIQETIVHYKKIRNMDLFSDIESLSANIKEKIKNEPHIAYYTPEYYVKNNIQKIQMLILYITEESLIENIKGLFDQETKKYLSTNFSKYNHYRMWTDSGLLRSSLEIYFYSIFTKKFPNIEISLDKRYPNSSMRYDFKIKNAFIEIAPLYGIDNDYTEKMNKKTELFGCILLKNSKDIDNYIENFSE
jgi:hypothetical protein